jgi:hypothetical protein
LYQRGSQASRSELSHGFAIWRLKAGQTATDLLTYFATGGAGGAPGPVPGEVVAGCGLLSPGKHAWFTSDLAPGEYLDACTVPGRNPPALHLSEGETAKITVG